MGKCEDRLRSGCELLRSGLAWMVEGYSFAASMSAGRVLKSLMVKRVREEKDFGTMNRKDFCGLMSFRVEFGRIVARFGRHH